MQAARDENSRVRLEAIVAASWIEKEKGLAILAEADKEAPGRLDDARLRNRRGPPERAESCRKKEAVVTIEAERQGAGTLHRQRDLRPRRLLRHLPPTRWERVFGLGFPPLANSKWVPGNEERLIKIVLKGMMGPMEVNGKKYPGQVPMTPFGGMLKDEEVAAVLTYVRNSFGNNASAIMPEKVKKSGPQPNAKRIFIPRISC